MKRYDIHVIHDGAGNMQQDGAGEYVLFDDAQAELAKKDLEIAELRKDAERYRWLRTYMWEMYAVPPCVVEAIMILSGGHWNQVDAAIDAAIAAEEQAK